MVTNWVEEIVNLFIKINFTIGNSFEVRLRDREREKEGVGQWRDGEDDERGDDCTEHVWQSVCEQWEKGMR